MTCKDCLHYGVCYIVENYGDEEANVDGVENDCNEFADRSRYVVREKGEWRRVYEEGEGWVDICTRCKAKGDETDFCPNCGADMRKGENG